jgi:protein-S-isoprenylcysteine O-methyltransferase Ste14
VWLIVLPFLWFSAPRVELLAIGAIVASAGLWVRAWAAGTLRKDEALITAGPYAFTRNPLFLGSFLIGVGSAVAGGHWVWPAIFLLFFVGTYRPTMVRETKALGTLFPAEYGRYKAEVPAFLPRVTPYRDGAGLAGDFSWHQYRRNREWEASLGALAAFGLLAAKIVTGAS